MDLVELQTVEEVYFVINLLKSYEKLDYYYVFVGGTKLGKDFWYWLKTDHKAELDGQWFDTEPNNLGGNENCLAISKRIDTGEVGFNDADCYGTDQMFVCQDVNHVNSLIPFLRVE